MILLLINVVILSLINYTHSPNFQFLQIYTSLGSYIYYYYYSISPISIIVLQLYTFCHTYNSRKLFRTHLAATESYPTA